jgi:hypothetical protein
MSNWMPCLLALAYILVAGAIFGTVGFYLGRWREQLHLLQVFKP